MSAHLEDRDVVVLCHQEDSALPVLVYNINGSPPLEESAEGISLSISSSRKERSVGVIVQSINTCPPVQRWGRRKVGKEGKREGEGEGREGKEKEEKRGGGREREGRREGGGREHTKYSFGKTGWDHFSHNRKPQKTPLHLLTCSKDGQFGGA